MVPVGEGSGVSQGENSSAFLLSSNLLGGRVDAESCGARVTPPWDKAQKLSFFSAPLFPIPS